MTARLAAVRRSVERRRAVPDERGFALMTVLAVIAVTSVVIAALFGLLLTTIRVTAAQEQAAREARAADGAVTAAIHHLQVTQSAASPDACLPGLPNAGFLVPFAGPDDVTVTCTPAADDLGPSAGDISLVGDRYAGSIQNWQSSWPWGSNSAAVASVSPSLLHGGGEALRINGSVGAKGGAAVLHTGGGTPAATVRGSYGQPVAGPGAGTGCGILDIGTTQVSAIGGATCDSSVSVPTAQAPPLTTTPADAVLPAGCAGPVVTFAPGYYDQAAVKVLNGWFRGEAGCTDTTFYFPPGSYWFDANEPAAGANQFVLTLDNPSSSFVFGVPKGWDPATGATAANFPTACTSRPGITNPEAAIVLSGRTQFRHVSGRLAVCPDRAPDGTEAPAMVQGATAPNSVEVVSVTSPNWANADNMRLGRAAQPAGPAEFNCRLPPGGTTLVSCPASAAFTMTLASAGAGPIDSASLAITGDEYLRNRPDDELANGVEARRAALRITHAGGTCDTDVMDGSPDRDRTVYYELISGTCRSGANGAAPITDASQLDGATVSVTYTFTYVGICFSFTPCGITPQVMTVWNLGVTVGQAAMRPAPQAPPSGWDATPCGQPFCGEQPEMSVQRSFTLNGVTLSSASRPLRPTDAVQSAGIVIRQTGNAVRLISTLPGQLDIVLRATDGTTCTVSAPSGVPNIAGSTYYPIVGTSLSNCTGGASTPGALTAQRLEGSSIEVSMRLDCINPAGSMCGDRYDGSRLLSYVRPVPVDSVSLVATTDTYDGPVTVSQLTVDSADPSAPASANFFGSVNMPNTALDIFWNGERSGASIFGGQTQLFSLGSVMATGAEADVVCCTKPETEVHKVRLTAWIGGEKKLSVAVGIPTDTSKPPEVLDWTVCGRNGSCV